MELYIILRCAAIIGFAVLFTALAYWFTRKRNP